MLLLLCRPAVYPVDSAWPRASLQPGGDPEPRGHRQDRVEQLQAPAQGHRARARAVVVQQFALLSVLHPVLPQAFALTGLHSGWSHLFLPAENLWYPVFVRHLACCISLIAV